MDITFRNKNLQANKGIMGVEICDRVFFMVMSFTMGMVKGGGQQMMHI